MRGLSGADQKCVHGEFTSTDASALTEATTARFTLYGVNNTARTVAADEYVCITGLVISTVTALTVDVYDGSDTTVDAGEKIAHVILAANSAPVRIDFNPPRVCTKGKYPKVKTSGAGQVDVILNGIITA